MLRNSFGPAQISKIDHRQIGTELCTLAALNDIDKMRLYIAAGIPVTLSDYDGRTPLHIAAAKRHAEMC